MSDWRLQFIKWLIHVYSCLWLCINNGQTDAYLINHFIELFETNDKHDYHKMSIYLRIADHSRQTHTHTSSFDYIIRNIPYICERYICWHGFILSSIYYLSLFILIILWLEVRIHPKSRWYFTGRTDTTNNNILKTDTFETTNGKLLI